MIGQRITARPGVPFVGVLFGLAAVVLVGSAVGTSQVDFAIAAIVPALIATASFATRRPAISFEFTEHGLDYESPRESGTIAYHEIERVWTPSRKIDPEEDGPRAFPIVVGHPNGELRLHRKLDVPSDDVYGHLLDSVPVGGSDAVHEDLADYLAEHRAEFGEDRVWAYRASPRKVRPDVRLWRWASLATALGGAIWIAIGATLPDHSRWVGGGIPALTFGLLFWLASFATGIDSGSRFKRWKEASLVVSPVGLALVQGDVRGEMTWDELRDVRLSDRRAVRWTWYHTTGGRGLLLKVEGATILVSDIYDRPLYSIYKAISSYWQ